MKRIDVCGDFTEALGARVVREIRAAAGRPIDMRIDSTGGALAAAVQICLEAEEHDREVFTTITGQASSAACIVALAGDVRRIDRRGVMMAHFPTPLSHDAAAEMVEIVRAYTGRQKSEIGSWLAREKVFDADEALPFGFADRIVDATAPEPVWLKEPVKRRPSEWLREYREMFEEHDLRLPTNSEVPFYGRGVHMIG